MKNYRNLTKLLFRCSYSYIITPDHHQKINVNKCKVNWFNVEKWISGMICTCVSMEKLRERSFKVINVVHTSVVAWVLFSCYFFNDIWLLWRLLSKIWVKFFHSLIFHLFMHVNKCTIKDIARVDAMDHQHLRKCCGFECFFGGIFVLKKNVLVHFMFSFPFSEFLTQALQEFVNCRFKVSFSFCAPLISVFWRTKTNDFVFGRHLGFTYSWSENF